MVRFARLAFAVLSLSCVPLVACSSADDADGTNAGGSGPGKPNPTELPSIATAPLTTDARIVPKHAVDASGANNPQQVDALEKLLADGYGEIGDAPGEPVVGRMLDDSTPPAPGPNARRLTRFVHLADTQLADDESPARLASFDTPSLTSGAFRPQEGYECRILNAAVRTINAVHAATPIDFVLLGGDNADNAQSNEIDWFQAILDGSSSVECDSGDDDDLLPGEDDPKDPFVAEGLAVPWRWVTGNHDVLMQGNLSVDSRMSQPIGTSAPSGTRQYSLPGAPVTSDDVVADPKRAFLSRTDLMKRIAGDDDGHGIGDASIASGKAYYTFDVADSPIRFVVMDTAAETGGADGLVRKGDLDGFMKPALDQAKADGKWVVLVSHHVSGALKDGDVFGGAKQDDAVTAEDFQAFVGGYDNVIAHIAGHTHVHRVTKIAPPGGHAYWELQTAALADFPHQMRLVEIWDQDDGFISIRGIALDYSSEGDPVAAEGRTRGIIDYTSGWTPDGQGTKADRNVELWIPKP